MTWNINIKKECEKCGKDRMFDRQHMEFPTINFKLPSSSINLQDEKNKDLVEFSDDEFRRLRDPEMKNKFIRTTMVLTILPGCNQLEYGIWVQLHQKAYDAYKTDLDKKIYGKTYPVKLFNKIPDYKKSTVGLSAFICTWKSSILVKMAYEIQIRSELILQSSDHDLFNDWKKGITFSEADRRFQNIRQNFIS